MDGFNQDQARRGALEVRIGIGIASGPLVAGFTGTERRVTYTCVGDTVNLASRLESSTKELGVNILISDDTLKGTDALGTAKILAAAIGRVSAA